MGGRVGGWVCRVWGFVGNGERHGVVDGMGCEESVAESGVGRIGSHGVAAWGVGRVNIVDMERRKAM